MSERTTKPTTPGDRAYIQRTLLGLHAVREPELHEPFILSLIDDIEERDALLARVVENSYPDLTYPAGRVVIAKNCHDDIRAALATPKGGDGG